MSAETVALIPARGGSKGVPRKNIRDLAGKPLIAYSIKVALAARIPTRVIVSTDDDEIAEIARAYGAEVPFLRPAGFATDTSPSISTVHHLIGWASATNELFDIVAILPPTCPFRTAEQIDAVLERLRDSNRRSAATICAVRNHPYFVYRQDENGHLEYLLDIENRPLRRQELPVFYRECQSVLASRRVHFEEAGRDGPLIDSESLVGVEIDEESAFDIDSLLDFEIAEVIARRRQRKALSA